MKYWKVSQAGHWVKVHANTKQEAKMIAIENKYVYKDLGRITVKEIEDVGDWTINRPNYD